ncbi:MAG: hypothetical protein IJ841_04680 [Prevotella sp.]|nr:hypothetical protein [Prevotella sp.]
MRYLKYLWLCLFVASLTLLSGCQGRHEAGHEADHRPTLPKADRETLWQQYDQRQQQGAILTDARQSYRVCNTRPSRLLPSQGAKQERTSGKQPGVLRYHYHQPLKRLFGGRARTETAPIRFVASRFYYIIALRRILR